jgi:hypothetical protein
LSQALRDYGDELRRLGKAQIKEEKVVAQREAEAAKRRMKEEQEEVNRRK